MNTGRTFKDIVGDSSPKGVCPRCGGELEVVLSVTAQHRRTDGKGGRGSTIAGRTRTMCESCAADSYEIIEREVLRDA